MAEKLEALWVVSRFLVGTSGDYIPYKVCQNRAQARLVAARIESRGKYECRVNRVTWG